MLPTFLAFALLAPPVRTTPALDASARALEQGTLETLKTPGSHDIVVALPSGASVAIELEPVDPLAPGATIVSATKTARGVVQRPITTDVRCWTGRIANQPDARAFVASAAGFIGGFIKTHDANGEHTTWLSSGPRGRATRDGVATEKTVPVAFDPALAAPGTLKPLGDFCHADEIAQPNSVPSRGGVAGGDPPCREVLLAIDTDVEYTTDLFGGNQAAALAYAIALTAATSEIYTDDLNVRLRVSSIRLWTGDDPWTMGNTIDQLYEFKDYWEASDGETTRDLAHFLSGRGLGGGVAWLPGVCNPGYAYGLSANLGGTFPYPLIDNNDANWDLMVFAHELGHNFGSPHTHDYDPPLDGCGLGDCSQAATGTIMSYCHTCPGGLTNIALNFHPGNVTTMLDFLADIDCDFGGTANGALAEDDYVTAGAGQTTVVDFLFNDVRANCEAIEVQSFDATTANGASVTLIPAGPLGGRPMLSVDVPASAVGDDTLNYTILDSAGATDMGTVFLDVLPMLAPTNVIGGTSGIAVSYYELVEGSALPDFDEMTPYLSGAVSQMNFPSSGGPFATSGRSDLVGAVFEGWVIISTTGFWTFFTESDDGSAIYVDNQLVVSNDGLHGMIEKSGVVGVQAGKHLLRVEFFENFFGAGEIVRAEGPGFAKAVIPKAMLRFDAVVSSDINFDEYVDATDLALVLGACGTASPQTDLNEDGVVDAADLAVLLGAWTG